MRKTTLFALFVLVMFIPSKVFAVTTTVEEVKDSMSKFIGNTAMTNAMAMSSGRDISSGYIGLLPHFSLEISQAPLAFKGITTLYESGLEYINNEPISSDQDVFENTSVGVIPYFVTTRIGGLKIRDIVLPMDLAFSIGGISGFNTKNVGLRNIDVDIDTFLIGTEIRIPIFTEQRALPGLSVGTAYGYTTTKVSTSFDMGILFPSDGIEVNGINILVGQPRTTVETKSQMISMKIHAHKTLFFIEPYLGIEPSVVISEGTLKVATTDITTRVRNPLTLEYQEVPLDTVKQQISSLDFITEGTALESSSTVFGLRFYGGTSLKIWTVYFNWGIGYEPFNDVLTTTFSGRLTL